MELAPVAFFVFNRPELTARVFQRIREARPHKLLLVADGPRASRSDDAAKCAAARDIVSKVDWDCEVLKNFSDVNLGCKRRVSSGLNWVFEHCSEAIVLEDDCLPSRSFFHFCSELLAKFRDDERIMHVGAANFQPQPRGEPSYYFSRYAHIWGWATWRRAWKYYDVALASWPQRKRTNAFADLVQDQVELAHWSSIFDRVHGGKIDTWDYQWQYACWSQRGLSIIPNANLVSNLGFGPDATHTTQTSAIAQNPLGEIRNLYHSVEVARNVEADRYTFEEHLGGKFLREGATPLGRARRALGRVKRKAIHLLASGS